MKPSPIESWQPSLFDANTSIAIDETWSDLTRIQLDPTSWVEHASGWVKGSDLLFDELLGSRDWGQRSRRMYDQRVLEPRLTAPWRLESGVPLQPPILEHMRSVLCNRYEVTFDPVGFNLYRNGNDSVAWHGDRIRKEIDEPIVALVSLGEPRRFLLRPVDGLMPKSRRRFSPVNSLRDRQG